MRKLAGVLIVSFLWTGTALAQGARDWATAGADAQRSSWVRTDAKISQDSMRKPGFQLLWKIKLNSDLTTPALIDRYIGYRGFRSLAFVGGSSDSIVAIDTDLGRIEWQRRLPSGSRQQGGTLDCPGGMTANVARATIASFPAGGVTGAGRGRGAVSGAGEPGQGAVTLRPVVAAPAAVPARGAAGGPPARTLNLVYMLSSDGMLHGMYVSNGVEPEPPVKFLPANANAQGLIVVDGVAYATTVHGCGGAPDAVWALDLASKEATSWKPAGGISGSAGAAIGPDGTLYVATRPGELVALEPKTLKLKDTYTAGHEFSSSPVLFEFQKRVLVAATTKDGRLHLLDSAGLTPLYKTAPSNAADFAPGALASWQDSAGARSILAATATAIAAWKVVERNGALVVEPAWVSRDMVSPLPPVIVNGVVFAVSKASPAVLYALDGGSGKELWSSGASITSRVRSSRLSGGGSHLYLGTEDGAFYAFGFPIEH